MNPRRIGVLLKSELGRSVSNFLIVLVIVLPLVLSLLVTLVFGDLFSQTPRLGVYAEDNTQMVSLLSESQAIRTTVYTSEAALRDSVARGRDEIGAIYRKGFDEGFKSGAPSNMTWLLWGESSTRSHVIIGSVIYKAEGQLIGTKPRVSIDVTQLGNPEVVSIASRLLPLFVLMTLIVGGVLVPAVSLVDEKQKRTLNAVTITPATLSEVYAAKALLGAGVCMVMATIVLVLNRAFGNQPLLLVSTLALGAIAASVFGVLLGSSVKDVNVLLATLKSGGLILIAPALIQFLPKIPQWVAYLFPTFYVMDPVFQVTQKSAGLGDIAGDVIVLIALIAVMLIALARVTERQQTRLALSG